MWNAELSQIVSVRVLCLASKILGKDGILKEDIRRGPMF